MRGVSQLGLRPEPWLRLRAQADVPRRGRRPTLLAPHALLAALCVGLATATWVRAPAGATGLGAAALGLAAVALPARLRIVALAAGILLAGATYGSFRADAIDRSDLRPHLGEAAATRVVVTGPARTTLFSVRVPVRVERFGDRSVDERALLVLPPGEPPPSGAVLETPARITAPRGREEGADGRVFDEAAVLARSGIHVLLRAHRYRVMGARGGLPAVGDRLRAAIAGGVDAGVSGERRALIAGVVLGADEELDSDLRDDFRASGLSHLLAVSGQNVAYLVAGVLVLGWIAGAPRVVAVVLALAAVFGYVLAVGWQPSVVRAGVAGGLACLAWLASRPRDRWYGLLMAAAVLLAWSPYSLLDPGFQLSFAAVAAIFICVPWLERRLAGYPLPARLASIVAVAGACGLATAPIVWFHFGAVPVLSVPANVAAEPVMAPILGLGLMAAALDPVLPGAAVAVGWANGWLAAYLAGCARAFGSVPFAQVRSPWILLGLLAVLAAPVGLRRLPRSRRRQAVAAIVLAATAGFVARAVLHTAHGLPPPEGLRVSFLDVGQGDAALLEVPEGAVLVDQGPPEARVAHILEGRGVRRLDAIVLTHPQLDHIGGSADVVRSLPVGSLLDPFQLSSSPERDATLEAARRRGAAILEARSGQTYTLGRLRLEVLWPDGPGGPGDDPNDNAIVLLARYGETEVLLTADAESSVAGRLRLPPIDVLKVAHHGSDDPGLPELLAHLRPRVAVVSVGAGNDYGHPAPATVRALSAVAGMRLFRTDRDGTVVVESDGTALRAASER